MVKTIFVTVVMALEIIIIITIIVLAMVSGFDATIKDTKSFDLKKERKIIL